jgi:hypothetical protein
LAEKVNPREVRPKVVVEKKIAGEPDGDWKSKPGWTAHTGSQNPKEGNWGSA